MNITFTGPELSGPYFKFYRFNIKNELIILFNPVAYDIMINSLKLN